MGERCRISPKTYLVAITLLSVILILFVFPTVRQLGKIYEADIYVVSPDEKYTIIIKEWGTIGGTGADIYIESRSSWLPFATRRKIGMTIADDCVYPFRDGYYHVSWESECVVIHYYGGGQRENPLEVNSWMGCIEYTLNK